MNFKEDLVFKLYELIVNDIELIDSLKILINIYKGVKKEKILLVKYRLEKGYTLSNSFKEISSDEEFLNFLKISEKTGNIKEIFRILRDKYEFDEKIKKEIKTLTIYPLSLFVISLIVLVFILLFIIPRFIDIYDQLSINLPLITRVVIFLSYNVYIIILPLLLLIIMLYIFREKIKNKWIFKEIYMINFLNTMYASLSAKIVFLDALKYSSKISNDYFSFKIKEAYLKLIKGYEISKIFDEKFFGVEFVSYISIAEKTGDIEKIFGNILKIYSERLRMKIKIYLKLLEPIMIVFISLFISIIIFSIMLPIFQMGENLKL